jgi:hypothetical protein
MGLPDYFEVVEGIAYYRPKGNVTFQNAVAMASNALASCHAVGAGKILIDARKLIGFAIPNTFERMALGEQMGRDAKGVIIAFLVLPEMIDPEHFGVLVARNRGAMGEVFSSEAEAEKWLRGM